MTQCSVSKEINFTQAPRETAETAWYVVVDGAIIGRVERKQQPGLNRVKDYRYSGSDYSGKTRMAKLWEGDVDSIGLDNHDRLAVKRYITKPKTDRVSAAQHLLDAYGKARVSLPTATDEGLVASSLLARAA
jgi:hypothetical protein